MNTQCPICGGWELGDGTEDADWSPCDCGDADDKWTAEELNARDAEIDASSEHDSE